MAKSGNTWFKIKRAKLRKQEHAARVYHDGPLKDRTMPSLDGVVVTVCDPQVRVTRRGKWRGRYVARVAQERAIAAPVWGVGQSRLIVGNR